MSEELVDTALLAPSIMAETEWHVENGANIAVLTPYTYFLTLSFDGGNYRGWQRQADASSVQQALEVCPSSCQSMKPSVASRRI
eukprot:m.684677 g.684677  ORF g.684677 m.684677 type:complete len:84 (+) comp22834_c0_seq13:165-416(+)